MYWLTSTLIHRAGKEWVVTGRNPKVWVGGFVAFAGGEGFVLIGRLLGHERVSTASRYAHQSDDRLQTTADWIRGRVAEPDVHDTECGIQSKV